MLLYFEISRNYFIRNMTQYYAIGKKSQHTVSMPFK